MLIFQQFILRQKALGNEYLRLHNKRGHPGVCSLRNLIIIVLSLFIVACGSDNSAPADSETVAEVSTTRVAGAEVPNCAGKTNLLKNAEFISSPDRLLVDWNSTQHGNIPSFVVSVEDGVVTIERNGPEPWYNLEQPLDLKDYAGHRMLYRADLKLSLDSENWPHRLEPRGGLQVLIWATSPPPLRSTRLNVNSSAEHTPNLGETGWFSAHTEFVVPERPKRSIIGLIHQANGSISVKNPALFDCGPAPESQSDG